MEKLRISLFVSGPSSAIAMVGKYSNAPRINVNNHIYPPVFVLQSVKLIATLSHDQDLKSRTEPRKIERRPNVPDSVLLDTEGQKLSGLALVGFMVSEVGQGRFKNEA